MQSARVLQRSDEFREGKPALSGGNSGEFATMLHPGDNTSSP